MMEVVKHAYLEVGTDVEVLVIVLMDEESLAKQFYKNVKFYTDPFQLILG